MDDSVKEIAKATNKALGLTEKVGGFLFTILGDACKEFGASIHDWAKYYRYKNIIAINEKVIKLHKKKGIIGKSIPIETSIGIPLIEAASIVEEETLQQMWAVLIANATDPNQKRKIKKSFIDILSSIDIIDALILDWFETDSVDVELGKIKGELLSEKLNLTESEINISMSNLSRLGLIDLGVPATFGSISIEITNKETWFKLSHLGEILIQMCKEKP